MLHTLFMVAVIVIAIALLPAALYVAFSILEPILAVVVVILVIGGVIYGLWQAINPSNYVEMAKNFHEMAQSPNFGIWLVSMIFFGAVSLIFVVVMERRRSN